MANLSKIKRKKMLDYLEKLKYTQNSFNPSPSHSTYTSFLIFF